MSPVNSVTLPWPPIGEQGILNAHEYLMFPKCFPRRPEEPKAPDRISPKPLVSANWMVGTGGFEPPTSCVSSKRSPPELRPSVSRTNSTNTGSDENL